MVYLTRDKVRQIIEDRPPGTTPEGIVAGLRSRGHVLQGHPSEEMDKAKTESTFRSRLGEAASSISERFEDIPPGLTGGSFAMNVAAPLPFRPRQSLRTAGAVAGAVGDVVGFGVGEVARGAFNVLPEFAQDSLSALGQSFIDSSVGQAAVAALGEGAEQWRKFSDKNPETAKDIEAAVNVAEIVGVGAIGRAPAKAGTKALAKRGAKKTLETIDDVIDLGISKGVKPTVVGKKTFVRTEQAKQKARTAVKAIARNKDALNLVNDAGETVVGRVPQNLNQFSQAIHQTKKKIFDDYKGLAKQADIEIDLTEAADQLDAVIANKAIQTARPEVIDHAKRIQRRLRQTAFVTADEADDIIREWNESLQSFFVGRGDKAKAEVEVTISKWLRKKLDDSIEEATGAGNFQALKRQYGALRELEEEVTKRAIVDARKAPAGLFDLTDVFNGKDLLQGFAFGDVQSFARGLAGTAVKSRLKFLNDPNANIKKMFQRVDKAFEAANRFNLKGQN